MEVKCSLPIQFGDFEAKIDQVYLYDDCVELPSSWPAKGADPFHLSFLLPASDEFLACNVEQKVDGTPSIIMEKTTEALRVNSTVKCIPNDTSDVLCNGPPQSESPLAVIQQKSDDVEINTTKCDAVTEPKVAIIPKVNGVTANELPNHFEKIELVNAEDTDQVSNMETIVCDKQTTNGDIAVEGEVNEEMFETSQSKDVVSSIENLNEEIINKDKVTKLKNHYDKKRTKEKKELNQNETIKSDSSVTVRNKPEKPKSPTTWAGLFHSHTNNNNTNISNNTNKSVVMNGHTEKVKTPNNLEPHKARTYTRNSVTNQTDSNISVKVAKSEPMPVKVVRTVKDPDAKWLGDILLNQELVFKPQAFIPRGLINTSNWCYINATLQALLVCPPFYQLLKSLPINHLEKRQITSTPILDSFIQLSSEFRSFSTKRGYQCNKEVRQGSPFEPICIYDMLGLINSSLVEQRNQEDAEEFQSSMLNGLHDEVTKLFANLKDSGISSPKQQTEDDADLFDPSQISMYEDMNGEDSIVKNEWEEVVTTKRNRGAGTRRADTTRTPISEMFRGELCTAVSRPGQKASIHYEPFFSLPLYVPSEHSWTIDDALLSLTGKEDFLEDNEADVTRQQTMETLPPILILHLKRFVYDKQGGSKKIDRRVDYKTDLVIGKDLLSKTARKYSMSQRSYKLFAVVYHHGEKASGGHYTTDVFHIGLSSWLRIDDQSIRPVPHNEVTRHNPSRTAYLLYYRRTDLG